MHTHHFRSVAITAIGALLLAGLAVPAQAAVDEQDPANPTLQLIDESTNLSDEAFKALEPLVKAPTETIENLAFGSEGISTILSDETETSTTIIAEGEFFSLDIPHVDDVIQHENVTVLEQTDQSFIINPTAGGVQVINVATSPVDQHRFTVTTDIPEGFSWQENNDGLRLSDDEGRTLAAVAEPWSVDADGKSLPTHFEIDGTNIIQVVDSRNAAFPIVSDPSVYTVGMCIGSIAVLLGGGWVKAASMVGKLKNIANSARSFSLAWRGLTGSQKFTVSELKYVVTMIRKYSQGSLSNTDASKVGRFIETGGYQVLKIMGLNECWNWYKAVR